MDDLRLDTNVIDYAILAAYFIVVLGVGFAAKRYIRSSLDYFLSGRSLPAWITGLAFISANLGALEVIGMSANGAQYGVATVNYYWIGAIPAMVFLGLVMMPFYYGSKVRSVPEYLRMRFNDRAHLFNAVSFAVATVLIAGVNLYALALVLDLLLGWPIIVGIVVAGVIVMGYISLGGLSSAIYNEVLQFFVIVAALVPITVIGLIDVGGWDAIKEAVRGNEQLGEEGLHALEGTAPGNVTNPIGSSWIGLVFGLGFVLSFGYWTTNFAEVQRALSAKDLSAAQRTPLIGAFPKLLLPFVMITPGLIAIAVIPNIGGGDPNLEYNNVIPLLMNEYLPNGMLGLAITGLMASFMAGVAANVSAFNTVVTTDIVEPYVRTGQPRRVVRALRPRGHDRRHRGGHGDGADRVDLRQPHELRPGAVLDLQRAALRHVHHRHVLAPDDARGGLLGPRGGHGGGCDHMDRLQGGLVRVRLGPLGVDVGRGRRVHRRRDRHRRRLAADRAQAGQRAAGPRLRDGERGRVRRPPAAPLVGVAEAARRHRPGGCHPPHDPLLVGAHVRTHFHHERQPRTTRGQPVRPATRDRRPVRRLRAPAGDPRAVRQRRRHRAGGGVNINLYGGLAMLAFGLLMLVWAFTRPLGDELDSDEGGGGPGSDGHGSVGHGDSGRE